jgi:hypothetical protein
MTATRTFSIKIRTRLGYDELDNIVGQYCRAAYGIHFGGIDNTVKIPRKLMVISCTDPADRDRIKAVFAMRGAHVEKARPDGASPPVAA